MTTRDDSRYTVRITCKCILCQENAERLGITAPLAAMVRPELADGLRITRPDSASKTSTVHRLVYAAHDPSLRGYSGTLASIPA